MKMFRIPPGAGALITAGAALGITAFVLVPRAGNIAAFCENAAAVFCETESTGASPAGENGGVPKGEPTSEDNAETDAPAPAAAEMQPAEASDWETPADIREMERAFLAEVRDKKALGTVRERFFVNDGATFVSGNVAVRDCAEEHSPDFEALLAAGAPLAVEDKSAPTVLIYHTHTTESYLPADTGGFYEKTATRSADPKRSVVRVGEELCAVLREHGVGVIHDTEVYDEVYTGAYARSRVTVQKLLAENPTVKIVFDVHRDAVYLSDAVAVKPTAEIGGKKAAQIMAITGVEEGPVSGFPNWEQNLRFALALQKGVQDRYEGLMKPIFFCRRKYNMDLSPCALLLEFGSDTNTLSEAVYAARLFGEALAALIDSYCEGA